MGWSLLATFAFVMTVGQADARDHSLVYQCSHTISDEPVQVAAPQDFHYSSYIMLKVKYADWMAAETVEDLPNMELRNSLLTWATDFARNPLHRIPNINAP